MNSPVQFRISPTGDIQINIPVNVDESKLPDVRKTKFPARYRILPTGDFQMAIPKNVDESKLSEADFWHHQDCRVNQYLTRVGGPPGSLQCVECQGVIMKAYEDSKCTDCALVSGDSPTIRSDKSSTTHSNKFCSKCHRKQPKECKCLFNK